MTNSNLLTTSLLSFIPVVVISILLLNLPMLCFSNDDERYLNCSLSLSCGNVTNLMYPFYGLNRANYCGQPGFELDCQDDVPFINIGNSDQYMRYRVVDLNPLQRIITVARNDFWETTCPLNFINTTSDPSPFHYIAGFWNLTLFYGCVFNDLPIQGLTEGNICLINGTAVNMFYSTRMGEIGPRMGRCNSSVIVPVQGKEALAVNENKTTVGSAIEEGVELSWDGDADKCITCLQSGGVCGFNWTRSLFSCFCYDHPTSTSCPRRPGGSNSSNKGLSGTQTALLVTGAILAGIGLGWIIFVYRQSRKRKAAAAAAEAVFVQQDKNKDNLLPLSNAPTSTTPTSFPSSNLSKNISSFTSSRTEFGRSTYFGTQIFSYEELEEATQSFDTSRELGDGGFGTVYYGILKDGRSVAVKRLYENNFKRVEQFMNEVEILMGVRHVNLVTLYGCTTRRSRGLLLVYEFIPNGTVADHLHGKRANSGLLSWSVRLNIAIETAEALAYLHALKIIHRDVKTNNILLDNDFRVKVADFGLSRGIPIDVTHVSTAPQGTPGYVDPEYYQCYQLTEKSDVYSFGVVLVELISSKQAVDTNRERQDINLANLAVNKIQNRALDELVDPSFGFETDGSARRMATLVAQLAFRCLQLDRDIRPSMEEVLSELKRIKSGEPNEEQKQEVVDVVLDDDGSSPL